MQFIRDTRDPSDRIAIQTAAGAVYPAPVAMEEASIGMGAPASAMGAASVATGAASIAMGGARIATGGASITMGPVPIAMRAASLAMGATSIVRRGASIRLRTASIAIPRGSLAIEIASIAMAPGQLALEDVAIARETRGRQRGRLRLLVPRSQTPVWERNCLRNSVSSLPPCNGVAGARALPNRSLGARKADVYHRTFLSQLPRGAKRFRRALGYARSRFGGRAGETRVYDNVGAALEEWSRGGERHRQREASGREPDRAGAKESIVPDRRTRAAMNDGT